MARPATQLQNPGIEAPTHLDFDHIPPLAEFFLHGGVPGVEYLYLLAEELPKSHSQKWSNIVGMPFFRVHGVDLTAVAKGTPISGAAPGSSVCKLHISKLAEERIKKVAGEDALVTTAPDADDELAKAVAASRARVKANTTSPTK